jgi:hypothetical protein
MRALLALTRGDEAAAAGALRELTGLLAKASADAPDWMFWPELLAAHQALPRPQLRSAALALLEPLQRRMRARRIQSAFARQVDHLVAVGQEPADLGPVPRPWVPVTHATAATRSQGLPRARWHVRDGGLWHRAGHREDCLYFAVPFRGNFTVTCELTIGPLREIGLSYGGVRVDLRADGKRYDLFHYTRRISYGTITPPLEGLQEWYAYHLVIQDGVYTAHVNGRKLLEHRLPGEPDPWLVLRCPAGSRGGVRNLKIDGAPAIPESLDLSGSPDLSGWLADYYGEENDESSLGWRKQGDEISAELALDLKGSKRESLLRYHRPLLEDGVIEYEFWHEPGKALVHPALDRLTLLLEPGGVKVHWLTDAQHDRGGLPPDNVTSEPANRRGPATLPLQANAWNRVRLQVAAGRIALALNDVAVYERPLEATNRRFFGLFHYADESEVRVRHVRYRGAWPRQMP